MAVKALDRNQVVTSRTGNTVSTVPQTEHPHRRHNPLTGEWVLVAPHRTQRPWLGAQEAPAPEGHPQYDSNCYLCPGNTRAGGHINPDYDGSFAFENDFAALLPDGGPASPTGADNDLFRSEAVSGECRVICYSPRHDLSLADMDVTGIARVVDVWAAQIEELGSRYPWVQVFENKGATMGASNPHPHGQVWATSYLPDVPSKELSCQRSYYSAHGTALLADVVAAELAAGERVVCSNDDWALIVPYWAVWPFETLLLPRRPVASLPDLTPSERQSLADILKEGLRRYDALFATSFPYSMGWHSAPTDGAEHPEWVVHAHFYPPLLRSATVRKFMVGFEMLGEAQRDLTPEQAAERLRSL